MDRPVPIAFLDIEDWILHHVYYHPNGSHSTHSLFQTLESVLKTEPSELDECNKYKRSLRAPELTAEEYESLRKPELRAVQRAVETLIKERWVKGKRDADTQGVVFFKGICLTGSGERETIRRARVKEKKQTPPMDFESRVRKIRKEFNKKTEEGEGEDSTGIDVQGRFHTH